MLWWLGLRLGLILWQLGLARARARTKARARSKKGKAMVGDVILE